LTQSSDNKAMYGMARQAIERRTNDAAAVADPNRVVEVLPPELVGPRELNRRRGIRTDADCIDEICQIVGKGITQKAAMEFVGVDNTQWNRWLKADVAGVQSRWLEAQRLHLEAIADFAIDLIRDLRFARHEAKQRYAEEIKEWRLAKSTAEKGVKIPEPFYDGPSELDIKIAEAESRTYQWKLERLHPSYSAKQQVEVHNRTSIIQDIRVTASTPEDAMSEYARIVSGKPE
jgi:hypothetical protein